MRSLNILTFLRHGQSSFILASQNGYDEIVDLLLKNGANVDDLDK